MRQRVWTGRLQRVHDCLELVVLALLISAVVLSYLTCVPPYSEDIPPATTTTRAPSTVTTTTVTTALSCMTPGCTISITIVETLTFAETVQTRVCRYGLGLAHDVAEAWEKDLHVAVLLLFLLMVIIRAYTWLTKPSREKSIPPALTCPKCGGTTEYSISRRYYCSNCQLSFSREVEV